PTRDIYRISCPACRMFGSHYFIGRLMTSDGYLTKEFKKKHGKALLETRDGVAIDRLTGGPVARAKYDLEVLTKGEFGTRLEIRNFERWQLGLLGLVLRDMCAGLLRIGMGKSRGLGRIKTDVSRFEVSYFGNPQEKLTGLATGCPAEESVLYGLFPETEPGIPLPDAQPNGLRYIYDLTDTWQTALEPAVKDLVAYIRVDSWPNDISNYTERRP
ncbi:MAG: RAMP superfamily CRISPR-associated protein, partial [Thermodesulfobacteriota bacterium]